MEFWGVEVKNGETLKVAPGENMVLHLSQACLGETKKEKANDSVCLFVNVEGKKLVLGTLVTDKIPQQQFDLVFDRDFELSHNWKSGSIYFYGYKASNPFDEGSEEVESDESDSEEDIPLVTANNAKPKVKAKQEKPAEAVKAKGKESDAGKQKVKIVEPIKDDDDDTSDDMMSEDDGDDDSEDDDSDDSGESDEETPKKAEPSKKRAAESATKTPVQDKKAKVTPQKTDGKKVGGHVATPYPAKQAGKTPGNKPNQQTPQSGGSVTCKSCPKTFGSDKALESHTKAKHSNK
ncbi:histone deacetylase HDT1-like [Salvia hispanica]|uniref:histone deacetylase HDT1-like n=1 Tax=Salvia hispanica TaxID=49212 RepID=UPI0020096C18|nr:histone deacetylase HDT1-like [Salvia hispanica]